jgi:hypothetical protein
MTVVGALVRREDARMTTLIRRTLAAVAIASSLIALPPALPSAQAAFTCDATHPNTEFRWGIKSLSDADRRSVDFHAVRTRLGAMRRLARPSFTVRNDTPRIDPEEMKVYLTRARAVQAKMEDDGDIILVLAIPHHIHRTLVVEFGNPRCVTSQFKRDRIGAARRAMLNNCGALDNHWTKLRGAVRVRGVGFWDEMPSEHGHAPNGFQLWPVLGIAGTCTPV